MRILRAIGLEPFHAGAREPHPWRPEALAKKLGESARLVKDRLARMERTGVIGAYDVLPDPATLGLSLHTYALRAPSVKAKSRAARELAKIDGVLGFVDFLDEWANVSVASANEAERKARLEAVQSALGGATPIVSFEPPADRPRPEPLTRTDWKLVRAMRGDARRPMHKLADEIGVTTKTVQRRLQKLSTEGAIDAFARLDARGLDEVLFATLKFRVKMDGVMPALRAIHGDLLTTAWAQCSATPLVDDAHFDLVVAPRSPKGLRDLVEKARGIPGVVDVEGHIATELVWMPRWIDAQIDARIEALEAQRTGSSPRSAARS